MRITERLTDEEAMLLCFYRAADRKKRCEVMRILDGKTIICSSVAEIKQHFDLLRSKAKEKTGE